MSECETWAERVSLLAADDLLADEAQATRQHLAHCPACRVRWAELVSLCRHLEASHAPSDMAAQAMRARFLKQAAKASFYRRAVWLASAAAALVLAAIMAWPGKPVAVPATRQPAFRPIPPRTLAAYNAALAQSPQALDDLLTLHAASFSLHTPPLNLNQVWRECEQLILKIP